MINVATNFIFGNHWNFNNPFVFRVDTRNVLSGGSASNQFRLPISTNTADSSINWIVDWGDGILNTVTSKADPNVTHTYNVAGIYVISIYPFNQNFRIPLVYEQWPAERLKIMKIFRWGYFVFNTRCFINCTNLDLSEATDIPMPIAQWNNNLWGNQSQNISRLSEWIFIGDTVNGLIYQNPNFNQPFTINAPNTTSLTGIIWLSAGFNQNIVINAPNVTNLQDFFRGATAFNRDVSTWFDWSKVTNLNNFMTGKTASNYNASYYDNLLIALNNAGQTGVTLGMGTIRYTSAGAGARANLIAKNWTITDGGIT